MNKIDHYRIKENGVKAYIQGYKELKEILKEGEYDIIHAHWAYAGILCSLVKTREKLIISYMGSDLQGIYNKKYRILTARGLFNIICSQYLLWKVDAVIVKSRKMLRWIPPFFRKKAHVIPNGVNLDVFNRMHQKEARAFLNLPQEDKFILFLGSTSDPNKNYSLLKESLRELDKSNITYKVLAPYPVDSSLVPYYLASADVFVLTSKLEGSPNVIKEALAIGCPIVATDAGDVRERIESVKGCFVAKYNKRDVAKKLIEALKFNRRTEAGEQLMQISDVSIAKKLIDLYECTKSNGKNTY